VTFLGLPSYAPEGVGNLRGDETFPHAARSALKNAQLRRNIGVATSTIRSKRAAVVGEVPDWEQLRPIFDRWIPRPRTLHPYPDKRFDARIQGRSRMR